MAALFLLSWAPTVRDVGVAAAQEGQSSDNKKGKKSDKAKRPAKPTGLWGRVIIEGNKVVVAETIPIGVDTASCGTSKVREALLVAPKGGVRNAVVSLVSPPKDGTATLPTTVTVGQKACDFGPHVAIVPKGGTVRFTNSDPILHNVRVAGKHETMNRVATQEVTIEKTFNVLGPHPLRCDFHAWMKGYVYVVDHAYHTLTDEQGQFSFDVPPGTYQVKVWHETLGTTTASLEVGKPTDIVYPASTAVVPPLGADAAQDWN